MTFFDDMMKSPQTSVASWTTQKQRPDLQKMYHPGKSSHSQFGNTRIYISARVS